MKKEDVSNDDLLLAMKNEYISTWLHSFGGAGTNSVEHASTHEAAVRFRFGTPNHTSEADNRTPDQDSATSEVC